MKLQIFGDSIMQGVIYLEDSGKYKLRSNRFAKLRESGIDVSNNSHMGATIEKGMSCLERKLDACDSDTMVLFEFGGNDCDFDWKQVSEAPDAEHHPNIAPEKFTELYKNAIRHAKSRGSKVAIATLVPLDAKKFMSWITRGLSYDNILHWLGDVSMLSRWQEYYSHLTEEIASETGCPVIDLRSTFLLTHSYSDCLCADGIHPTEQGYTMIEEELTRHIIKYA